MQTMETKNKEFNPIEIADDIITQLYYLRNKEHFSESVLMKGISLFEYLVGLSNAEIESPEVRNTSRILAKQNKELLIQSGFKLDEQLDSLHKGKDIIKKLIVNPTSCSNEQIEIVQDLLLKVSMPVWKKKIMVLKDK
jgi:hypothetical protein